MNARTKVTLLATTAIVAAVALAATTILATAAEADTKLESTSGTAIKVRSLCPSAAEYFEIQKMAFDFDKAPSARAVKEAVDYVRQHCRSQTKINDWYFFTQRDSQDISGHAVTLACVSLPSVSGPCLWTDLTALKLDPPVKDPKYIVRAEPKTEVKSTQASGEASAVSGETSASSGEVNADIIPPPKSEGYFIRDGKGDRVRLLKSNDEFATCATKLGKDRCKQNLQSELDVYDSYKFYALIKYCHEIRQGYAYASRRLNRLTRRSTPTSSGDGPRLTSTDIRSERCAMEGTISP
jgi:hypothetical protein